MTIEKQLPSTRTTELDSICLKAEVIPVIVIDRIEDAVPMGRALVEGGLSVLEVVRGFEQATGIEIPFEIVERRPGDVPRLEACPKQAEARLGWKAQRSLLDMCRDGWAWQQANPLGYRTEP